MGEDFFGRNFVEAWIVWETAWDSKCFPREEEKHV
jgi:hypothetical protein